MCFLIFFIYQNFTKFGSILLLSTSTLSAKSTVFNWTPRTELYPLCFMTTQLVSASFFATTIKSYALTTNQTAENWKI